MGGICGHELDVPTASGLRVDTRDARGELNVASLIEVRAPGRQDDTTASAIHCTGTVAASNVHVAAAAACACAAIHRHLPALRGLVGGAPTGKRDRPPIREMICARLDRDFATRAAKRMLLTRPGGHGFARSDHHVAGVAGNT